MKTKNVSTTIYWVFWFLTTIANGILAGFLISHSLMLGRFFSWLLENDYNLVFTDYFSEFRAETGAHIQYNLPLYFGFISGIGYMIICFIKKKTRIVALLAGMSTFWVSILFFTWDFNNYEEAVSSGIADADTIQKFLAWNLPLHRTFALIYLISFIILLVTGFIVRGKSAQK